MTNSQGTAETRKRSRPERFEDQGLQPKPRSHGTPANVRIRPIIAEILTFDRVAQIAAKVFELSQTLSQKGLNCRLGDAILVPTMKALQRSRCGALYPIQSGWPDLNSMS